MSDIIIGASTACFCPLETEKSLEEILSLGIKDIEIFFNTERELCEDYVKELRAMVDSYGARILSIHPYTSGFEGYLFFTSYQRRHEDALEYYKRYFNAANILGADILVFHGEKQESVMEEQKGFERYEKLVTLGKSFDVNVAYENVHKHKGANPEYLKRMRENLGDNAQFVFDIKQAVRSGYDPYDFLERCGEGVIHIHANDHIGEADCLPPGKGQCDYRRIKEILCKKGAHPAWIVELYRRNFSLPEEILDSVNHLNKELN